MKRITLSIISIFFLSLLSSCSSQSIVIDDPEWDISGFTLSRESFKDKKLTGKKHEVDMDTMEKYISRTLDSYYACDEYEEYCYTTRYEEYDWGKSEFITEDKYAADIKENRSKRCYALKNTNGEFFRYSIDWFLDGMIYKKQFLNDTYKKIFYEYPFYHDTYRISVYGEVISQLSLAHSVLIGVGEITKSSFYSVDEDNYEFSLAFTRFDEIFDVQCVVKGNEVKWLREEIDQSKGEGTHVVVYQSAARKNTGIKIEDPIDMDTYEYDPTR